MDTLNANERSLGRALGKRALVYIGILVLFFALVLILNTSNASAAGPTPVTGPIAADTDWNATGSPYYVTGDVTVNAGVTLTIWPNTTVAFAPGTSLNVAGTLHVLSNGTSVNKVVTFTSNQTGTESPGDWDGIYFESGSVGSFSNARVLYAYNAIWMNNASVTFTGLTTIADTENYALTYTWATGNHTVTLSNFAITNAYVGVDIGAAPGGNAGLTLSNSDIVDSTYGVYAYSNDGDLSVVLRNVGIEASYPATLSAPNGEVNLDVLDDSVMDAFGSATAISITAEDLIDVNLVGLTLIDALNGVSAYSNSGDIVLSAVDCWFELIPGNALQINAVEGTIAITLTNTVFNETATSSYIAAVYANAFSDLSVTTNGVQVINSSWGFALWNTNDTITLDLTDTVLNGAAMIRGIWTGSDNGNVVFNSDGLSLVMYDTYLSSEDRDAINVAASASIAFEATDLSVDFGFDAVHLQSGSEGVSVSIVGLVANNFAGDAIRISSAANVALTLENGLLNNSALTDQYLASWGVEVYAMTGIEASITNVEMITLVNGILLETDGGDILATMNSVDMFSWSTLTWRDYLPINGVVIDSYSGSVDANLTDVSIETLLYGWYGYGVEIYANNSIALVISGLNIAVDSYGLWVESYYGDIDAAVDGLVINNTDYVGASFYADEGAIDLAMSNSEILNSDNAALVVQAVSDTQVVLDSVVIANSNGDGVIIVVTTGNLVLDATNIDIYDIDGVGIKATVANGQIEAVIDPSSIAFVSTGIYLDAMGAVDLSIYDSFVGDAWIGIEIHSFDGGINVLLDNVELGYTDVYGLFADADNSDIMVRSINGTTMTNNEVAWYLVTSNGSVSINVEDTTFEYGLIGILVDSSNMLDANIVDSYFLGQDVLGMDLYADVDIVLNVEGSTFDGQIAENAQLFYPTFGEEQYIIIQPEPGNWTTDQGMYATLPFDFEFNGGTYNEVLMSLNGWLSLGSEGDPNPYSVYYFGSESPNLIAPAQYYWSAYDPAMDGYFHGMGYKYDGELNAVIFQWFVWDSTQPQLKNVFEAILYASGNVEFRYAMMDGYGLSGYCYGINMYDGPNWDLDMIDYVFYLEYQSVYFSMEMMSDGAAIDAVAGENMDATISSSSFSHYMNGAVLLVSESGWSDIDLQRSSFSYIYATYDEMGAFVAEAVNNIMTAYVSECSFDTIATAAIVLMDAPSLGGEDSFLVENNNFNEVIMTALIETDIYDEAQDGTAVYVSNKVFVHNDGTHVGMMGMATFVSAELTPWNIQETDVIEDNNFTGDIDLWLLEAMPFLYPGDVSFDMNPAMMNVVFGFESALGDNEIAHSVSVARNILSDGPTDYYDGFGMYFGAVTVYEAVATAYQANLTKETSVSVVDNVFIADSWSPLYSGVEVVIGESLANPVDGWIVSNVDVEFDNNTIESWISDGIGLGLYVAQDLNDGKGEGTLNVDVLATDNVIDGFSDGINFVVDASVSNLFGDSVSSVNALVRGNDVYSYDDGVEIDLGTSATFQHYFPPYEQVVSSAATMAIVVEVYNNTVSGDYDGITVVTSASATEDEYGVFTDAYSSITGPVNVNDNYVYTWDGNGVDVESYVSAAVSMASAMSDVPVTVVNNTIDTTYGTGIYLENFASAWTLDLRYEDQPSAQMISTVNVMDNILYGGSGIAIDQRSEATGGNSHAMVIADVVVMSNDLSGIYYTGISVDVSGYANSLEDWWTYQWAEVTASVIITENTVSGYSESTGIEVTVLPDESSDWYVDLEGSVSIVNNTVSGVYTGIYAWTQGVPLDITQNTVSDIGVGIEASGYDLYIFENILTGVTDDGIWLFDSAGMVANNTIEGAGSVEENSAEGMYLDDVWDLTIQGNTIRNVGSDGISATYLQDVWIELNTFENIGYSGVYLEGVEYTSYDLTVSSNTFTNIGDSAVEVNDIEGLYVLDNVITSVYYYGVEVDDGSDVLIENNTMSEMSGGVDMYNVYNVNIIDNVMSASATTEDEGIDVDGAEQVIVTGNEMTGFANGVEFDDVYSLVFSWNMVTGSLGDGAYFYVGEAVIENNFFSDNRYEGVVIEDSYLVTFANNVVANNGLDGLLVYNTESLIIVNGMFVNNGDFGIEIIDGSVVWNVDSASAVEYNDVLFSGYLTVMEGGALLLNGVEFIITNEYMDGPSVIEVLEGGALTTVDVEFYIAVLDELPSVEFYVFNVYGMLDMSNTEVYDALELFLGATSTAIIQMSTIAENVRNGIHIVDCAPVIRSCTIASNPRNGIFVEGSEAAPVITDCMIANNDRGIYAIDATLEQVTDNVIVLNSEAGIMAENVNGRIHDNLLLLNNKEIYVKNSDVSIQDNQIGYTQLAQVIAQFVPLLQGIDMDVDIFLPELGLTISPSLVQSIMLGHVGLYAVDSTVTSSGNQFGMLSTAVQVVNSHLTFADDIRQNTIILPYMDSSNIVRNMSLPIPVYDGIVATDSTIVMNGGSIDVLDDAVFLDHSTATIGATSLKAMDFSIYLIDGSEATVTDSTFGKVKVEDTSTLDVWEKLTVVVKDPWGTALANVPVTVGEVERTTDSNGMTEVYVEAYVVTSSGKAPMNPYLVTANYTNVPTTSYPGHASWSPAVVSEHVTANGPTTVVMVSSVIVRFDLTVHAMDKDGKSAVNVTVKVLDASGEVVAQAQSDANGVATFEPIGWIKNADGTTDNSMTPYEVTAEIGKDTARASTDLTGNTNLDVKVDLGPQFDYGPAIIIGVFVVILVAILLLVTRRKP